MVCVCVCFCFHYLNSSHHSGFSASLNGHEAEQCSSRKICFCNDVICTGGFIVGLVFQMFFCWSFLLCLCCPQNRNELCILYFVFFLLFDIVLIRLCMHVYILLMKWGWIEGGECEAEFQTFVVCCD